MAAAKNEIVPTEKTGELVDIALKAMATKPEDRHQSVRELQNAIEYAVVLARQNKIGVKELPTEVQLPVALQQTERTNNSGGVQNLDDMERNAIIQALAQCHGNKKKAAQVLGIQRPTLYNKMKRYAIEL